MHLPLITLSLLCLLGITLMYATLIVMRRVNGYQHIYTLSPQTHQKKMAVSCGGIGITLTLLVGQFIWPVTDISARWVLGTMLLFAWIGFMDDFLSITQNQNKGLSAKQKMGLQLLSAASMLMLWHFWISPLHWVVAVFYLFLIVGSSNATNLTDGLDGLLGGLSLLTLSGFALFFWQYHAASLWQLCLMLLIAVGSFLIFNVHPAKIFMGDTGSLALGAGFGALAIAAHQPLILLPLGVVYIIETLSVILQVGYFKQTRKRLFLMTPLHHHFELLGLSERQVVALFWAIGALGFGVFLWGM